MAVVLAGCNDDIFLAAADELPEVTETTIAGDGGEVVFDVPVRGLLTVTVDHLSDLNGLTCYDHAGNVIPEGSPARQTARISFRAMLISYDIYIDGGRIRVCTIEHPSTIDGHISIRLDYDYGVKWINVTVQPGRPLEIVAVGYDTTMDVTSVRSVAGTMTYLNDTSLPQLYQVRPWLGISGTGVVDVPDIWAHGIKGCMRLPERDSDGVWSLGKERAVELSRTFYSYCQDWEYTVDVSIPAYAHVSVATEVTFDTVVTGGAVTFRAPVSGNEYHTIFKTTLTEPVAYEITLLDVD